MKSCKKIIAALFMAILSVAMYAAPSEKITLSLSDVSIESALKEIEKAAGVNFIYSKTVLDLTPIISLKVKDESLKTVLDKLFAGTKINWEQNNKRIILSKKTEKSATQGSGVNPKDGKPCKVSGSVRDVKGEPLGGTVVMVPGTDIATVTDINGNFSMEVAEGSTLEFLMLGFRSLRKNVYGKSDWDIILEEDDKLLDEAVVIGYGTVAKRNLSTSVSSVKADRISKVATSTMSSMLLGRASGLNASVQNPQPDGKVNLSIRAGGSPLYVVDGIVMPSSSMDVSTNSGTKLPNGVDRSPLVGLNPADIETIEVLKDASASIYGIGASDGVIIITTKKGVSGKPRITYDGSYSFSKNKKGVRMLNAREYMMTSNVFNRENYLYTHSMYPYGPNYYDGNWEPLYPQSVIDANEVDNDWISKVLRNGHIHSHSISLNGGLKSFKYYLSFSYFDQKAVVKNSGMKKYILRSNVSVDIFPFLHLNTIINYNNNNYSNSSAGIDSGSGAHTYGAYQAAAYYSPMLTDRQPDGSWTRYKNMPNPVALLTMDDRSKQENVYTNFSLSADIYKKMLTAKVVYGFNSINSDRSYYIPSDVYFNEMYRSRGEVGRIKRFDQTVEATLAFSHKVRDILSIDAIVGFGFYFKHTDQNSVYYENTNDAIANDMIQLAAGPYYPQSSKSGSQRRSQFARVNFDILDRYIVSAAIRRDGTDKFFKSKKYAWFPSVSVAWKMSNEAFLKDVSWLDQLKIRASYGVTGRDNLGSALLGLYTPSGSYVSFGDKQYIPFIQSSRDYPDVTWEKTRMLDVGLDFSFLNERLSGAFDFYNYDETNQLSYDPESWLSQFASHPVNAGHYRRIGFDISLVGRPVQTRDFAWEITLNLSRAKTYWVEREPNYQYKSYQIREKEPLNTYYYYKSCGVINLDKSNMPESQKSLDASWQMPGVAIIKDKNGDNVINEEDIYMDDDGQPKFYGGIGTTFRWKGFDLDIYLYGRYGIRRWNTAVGLGSVSEIVQLDSKNVASTIFDCFSSLTNPYNATRTGVANLHKTALPQGVGTDLDVFDASFLRVKNITLGYTFSNEMLKKVGKWINTIRLYVDVQNPFVITKYPIYDPEIKHDGGYSSKLNYPQSVSFTGGVRIVL